MNPLHYPSLEPCEKLTEIGFPKTFATYVYDGKEWHLTCATYFKGDYICPSVMEMLDVMPEEIIMGDSINLLEIHKGHCCYFGTKEKFFEGTTPNALAEMILWLVENNHLSFNN